VETAQVCAGPAGSLLAASKRGLKRGLKGRQRTVVLFTDATIITETPPRRAGWALKGKPVEVPIMGNRNKGVLYGALNPRTGEICLDQAQKTSETCEGPVARLEHRAIPGLGFASQGQEEPETGQGVGDRATLVAGGLSGTEPSGRAMAASEGDRPGQSAHPLDGGVDGTSLWIHPIPFSGGAFAAGRSLVR
jgi:hypothetical protein